MYSITLTTIESSTTEHMKGEEEERGDEEDAHSANYLLVPPTGL